MRPFSRKNSLILIALFFAGSAAIRLGDGVGLLARAAEGEAAALPQEGGTCAPTPATLAKALTEREARLAAREAALTDRAAAIALADTALRGRLAALEAAEASLRETVALSDKAAEVDLARLTSVYEAMKPREAAALFDEMDENFAAGFLGRMRPDSAAAVLAGMVPAKAYAVSAILAGRNANAPRN